MKIQISLPWEENTTTKSLSAGSIVKQGIEVNIAELTDTPQQPKCACAGVLQPAVIVRIVHSNH